MAKILVIDDERLLCDLLRELLSSLGHEVYSAYSGRDGIEAFQRHRPRFTLLDLMLPDMSGVDILRQIRQIDPESAVIILTGGGSEKMEADCRYLGIQDFLIKGLSADDLVAAIKRAMDAPAREAKEIQEENSILIVDDEPQICDVLTQFLTGRGYRVRSAPNGQAGLAEVDANPPQLIVLDLNMPGMNGVEVLRRLRAKRYPGGVMMLTSSTDESLLKQTLALGSVDIVSKAADLERIVLAIEVSLIISKR